MASQNCAAVIDTANDGKGPRRCKAKGTVKVGSKLYCHIKSHQAQGAKKPAKKAAKPAAKKAAPKKATRKPAADCPTCGAVKGGKFLHVKMGKLNVFKCVECGGAFQRLK